MSFRKKLIFFLVIFLVVFIFTFSLGYFLKDKKTFLSKFKKFPYALALDFDKLKLQVTPYLFPRFPERLIYLLGEGEQLSKEIVELNDQLATNLEEKCDCKNAISQCFPMIGKCVPANVLGSACTDVGRIDMLKEDIGDKIDNLSLVREILIKEMEGGLEEELKTMRPELAEEIRKNLDDFLKNSEDLIKKAKENRELYSKDYTFKCKAECKPGPVCGFKACAILGLGAQRSIEIKAKIGIKLKDIDLGELKIGKIGLALPEKIELPQLGAITIPIPSQTAQVCFPFGDVHLTVGSPSLGKLPTLSFTCPPLPKLKFPEFKVPKLPKEFKIPSVSVPPIKWCPEIPEIIEEDILEKLREEAIKTIEQQIEDAKREIDEAIRKIDEEIKNAPREVQGELNRAKEDLLREYEKIKKEIPEEGKTPPVEFKTPEASKEYQYKSPEIKGLETDLSLSYQCGQITSGSSEVESGPLTSWYFEILSFLMDQCVNLPTWSRAFGSIPNKDCYNPEKVVETIIKECDSLWANYCMQIGSASEIPPQEPPEICKKIRYSCDDQKGELSAIIQCNELFKQQNLPVPPECAKRTIETIKQECAKLKDKGVKQPPLPCKLLPLFMSSMGAPGEEIFSSSGIDCPAQTLLNLPFGFGGGIGFSCPIGIPIPPKIVLPDIVIPDIILPEFSVPPFFKIKLPRLIIEDINLPDIELCDLNKCKNIFPDLNFTLPSLDLPHILDLSIPIPQVPNLTLHLRLGFPSVSFSLPQINLFNLLLPKIELSGIHIHLPSITFGITGIDLSAIFDWIFTFILNALGVPNFGLCLIFKIPSVFLAIVFPDYYISLVKFPESVKIPECEKVNEFCERVKKSLCGEGEKCENGWIKKAQEIKETFDKEVVEKIQKELNKISQEIASSTGEVQKAIVEVVQSVYGEAIVNQINKELEEKGTNLEKYIETQKEKECFKVRLPEIKIVIKIVNKKDFPGKKRERKGSEVIVYVPVDIPTEIKIPWPEKLKKGITLINPIEIKIGKIPLCCSYEGKCKKECVKNFSIKGPGFQARRLFISFGKINEGSCDKEPPSGGNPFPIPQIEAKIERMKDVKSEIEKSSQETIKILR